MKVVLDTNILVSGLLLPQSTSGKIVEAWLATQFELLVSQPLLNEIEKVLSYQKINKRLQWNDEMRRRFLLLLRLKSTLVTWKGKVPNVKVRDAADVMVLATYMVGKADVLITGDKDLLVLNDKYSIISPAEFVSWL